MLIDGTGNLGSNGDSGGGKRRQRTVLLTETQKVAMDVASAWLAYQYLKRRSSSR